MKVPFVDLKAQYLSIKDEIDSAIQKVIDNTAFVGGRILKDFEDAFAGYCGVAHAVGCANGTDAIEIALKAMGIKPGDEVIVPAGTWISTAEAVSAIGAVPVFADILPGLYTIDPGDIDRKVTARTRAIIPVHLYGLPAEMDEIMQVANQHGLKVMEDCAQAHGATYKGKKAGTFGDAASFSFYPGKNLGAYGDGGAMITNDNGIAETMRMICNHGQQGKHNHLMEGRNSRLDGIQAAVLKVKLNHIEKWTRARNSHAIYYNEKLKDVGLVTPTLPDYSLHVFHLYVVQVENRDHIMKLLAESGITTGIHYPTPLPYLKAYEKYGHEPADFPVAYRQKDKILSLPMFPELTTQQIDYVCEAFKGELV